MTNINSKICPEKGLLIESVRELSNEFSTISLDISAFPGADYLSRRYTVHQNVQAHNSSTASLVIDSGNTLESMQTAAKSGKFLGAIALKNGIPIGCAWGSDEIPVYWHRRFLYQIQKHIPHALINQLGIYPQHDSEGIAPLLMAEVLNGFTEQQVPSIYIPDIKPLNIEWITSLGFKRKEGTRRVSAKYPNGRWRYDAPSVASVQELLGSSKS